MAPTETTGQGEAQQEPEAQDPAKYDLTQRMAPFLDRHMLCPIFRFLRDEGMHSADDVTRAELEVLKSTNMIDFQIDLYKLLGEEVPEVLMEKREELVEVLEEQRHFMLPLLEKLEQKEAVDRIQQKDNYSEVCNLLQTEYAIGPNVVDGLFGYAKLQFECGNYQLSCELLKHYGQMVGSKGSERVSDKGLACLWGKAASLILAPPGLSAEDGQQRDGKSQYIQAVDALTQLSELIDNSKVALTRREVLLQKAWLLHWALFAIFRSVGQPQAATPALAEEQRKAHALAQTKILDLFLCEKSLSIISLACPHLFRYVGACLILQKRLKHLVKETVWIIHHESTVIGCYSDPVTRFLLALYTDMDFDLAQRELQQCELVCKGDYFLKHHWGDFEENARLHIFETYCRIHQCINIEMIASKLNMGPEEAELWIVKLIQSAKLDARIDSEKSRVVMSKAPPSVYQQVIEKTKNLSFRSTMLLSNLTAPPPVPAAPTRAPLR